MFEEFRRKRAAAHIAHEARVASQTYQHDLAAWQVEHDAEVALIEAASHPNVAIEGLVLHQGERGVGMLTNCGLVEERRGQSHYVGGSQGFSIPIGSLGGRTVRYHVSAQRGHIEQGPMAASVIATGTMFITDQRIVFTGPTQTRECAFAKVVAVNRDDQSGTITIAVSNRQKPTVITYGSAVAGWVGFNLDLALAMWRGDDAQFVENLKASLSQIDARRPTPPPGS